jgi:hypothetical protein
VFDRRALERLGFVGFVPFSALKDVPKGGGVYAIIRESKRPPTYLDRSVGGTFRGDPTEDVSTLKAKWVKSAAVLYLGKGVSLHTRVSAYARFGAGSRSATHWGGRYIWQLSDSAKLLVAWKECAQGETPEGLEQDVVRLFKEQHGGRLPFANISGSSRRAIA